MELLTLRNLLQQAWANFPFNLFDFILIASYVFYVYEETLYGFYEALIHLLAIIAGFLLGLAVYSYISVFLQQTITITKGSGDAISFFLIALLTYLVVVKLLSMLKNHEKLAKIQGKKNKIGAFICGTISFFLIASFLTTLILSLPISEYVKSQARDSFSGKLFFSNSGFMEGNMKRIFGGAINEGINFLTVMPASDSTINLHFKTTNVTTDPASEQKMLTLINLERARVGVEPLAKDPHLQVVATLHAKDMLKQGYFSHFTPAGFSPFDRLANKNITYDVAAENLAYAPDVLLAMNGLMKSPGHRANILNPQFKKVGVGVVDGKIYGKMFVQEFTD